MRTDYDSDAVAECIRDLCEVLGVDQSKVNHLFVTPSVGHVVAEIWLDSTEPHPNLPHAQVPAIQIKGWHYPLAERQGDPSDS